MGATCDQNAPVASVGTTREAAMTTTMGRYIAEAPSYTTRSLKSPLSGSLRMSFERPSGSNSRLITT